MKESKNYNVEEGLAFDVWYNRDLVWYNDIIDMSRFEGVFYHEQYRGLSRLGFSHVLERMERVVMYDYSMHWYHCYFYSCRWLQDCKDII
jgi:hypothetical protein